MSDQELVIHNANASAVSVRDFLPIFDISQALERRNAMVQFVQQIMIPNTDFGQIPGTSQKNVLLKPGAEKLCSFFGLSPEFILVERTEDWTGEDHAKEAFFYYLYRCRLSRNGRIMGEGDGSCNSWETKYRYRNGERKCPQCGKAAIIKGKAEYGGGFICFGKKGGCGAKFTEKDVSITGQDTSRVPNPDIADIVNTIQKMAQKRALVAAVLIAVNASDYFTQDIEDLQVIETEHYEPPQRTEQEKPKQEQPRPNAVTYERPAEQPNPYAPFNGPPPPLPVADPVPPPLQEMYKVLAGQDKFKKLDVFKELHASLSEVMGKEAAELKYREILNHYGVQKSNEFKGAKNAQCAARDMYLAIQKAVAPIPAKFEVSDDDLPANLQGDMFGSKKEASYGTD